jgi:hypothetical protein
MNVLRSYLPPTGAGVGAAAAAAAQESAGYKEGGALYALGMFVISRAHFTYFVFSGLIHANHGSPTVIAYLLDQLGAAQSSPLKHGACLGESRFCSY